MTLNIAFSRAMATCVWVIVTNLIGEKGQGFTVKVEATRSSEKLVGPTYYVKSEKRAGCILRKLDAIVFMIKCFYTRDKVRFVLRTRKTRLYGRWSRYSD
jgi:hypothetical protein